MADQGTALQRGQGAGSQVSSVLHMPLYALQVFGGASVALWPAGPERACNCSARLEHRAGNHLVHKQGQME